jgi:hypothetical protein
MVPFCTCPKNTSTINKVHQLKEAFPQIALPRHGNYYFNKQVWSKWNIAEKAANLLSIWQGQVIWNSH